MDRQPRIIMNKNRKAQIAPTRRKRFTREMKRIFLETLAATANVALSAKTAGISYSTAYRTRMSCETFRADWSRALEQGYARLETMLIERAASGPEPRIEIDGDHEPPDAGAMDADLAMQLLREHKRGLAGIAKPGAARTVAPLEDVRVLLFRKLRVLGVTIEP